MSFFYTVCVQNKREYTYSFFLSQESLFLEKKSPAGREAEAGVFALMRGGVMETEETLRCRLREIGFSEEEIHYYFKLLAAWRVAFQLERLRMLGDKRKETLEQIHSLEQNIMEMDIMRSEIRKKD